MQFWILSILQRKQQISERIYPSKAIRGLSHIYPIFLSKFWHISDVRFDRKCINLADVFIFYNIKSHDAFCFLIKPWYFWEKRVEMNVLVDFWDENGSWEKLLFYFIYRKMENVTRCISILIIMPANFILFCEKIIFNCFTKICFNQWTFKNSLKYNKIGYLGDVSKYN